MTAIGLMIGFYALALGLIFGLLWIPYAEWTYLHRIHPKIALLCIIAAVLIARGCFFLADKFQPPGPELTPEQQPQLFALITEVATGMNAKMPQHVYLMPDVNAFVAEVGGWMGIFGTRRVMAIGMGMLNTDSVSQLKATIAHEFGHFEGGDTRLGGFLYRTRASIGRVIGGLGESLLSKPFEWYGKLFLKLTHAISREQELAADTFSVKLAGKTAHIEGLRREAVGGNAFQEFLQSEVTPLIEEGYKPNNLFEGFRQYLANQGEDGMLKRVEEALDQASTDPYDSHPALRERIAFAQSLPDVTVASDDRLARELLKDPRAAELEMTRFMLDQVRNDDGSPVKDIDWANVAGTVYATRLARMSDRVMKSFVADELAQMVDHVERCADTELAKRLAPQAFEQATPEPAQIRAILVHALGAHVAMLLTKQPEWRLVAEPGRPVLVRTPGGSLINTFQMAESVMDDRATLPAFRRELKTLGLDVRGGSRVA